ncbi:hypothetical protein diail_1972 [Diaporthe ilicicola]|nr:hypothetical protein diail_1972 [Diaporthe ilicicola]
MNSTASPPALPETSDQYWRRVAGGDVERMLKAVKYQDAAIERFMQYFTTCILPAWGDQPQNRSFDPISKSQPSLNFDNTPIESSFNITSTNPNPTVRLSVEIDRNSAQNALDEFLRRNGGVDQKIDMSWTESLHRSILSDTAGSFGDMGIGFDLKPKLPGGLLTTDPEAIPADAKAYFVAVWKAREENMTRWELIRQSILDLPNLQKEAPGIVSGLRMVDDFLSGYPLDVENLISIVATDLVGPTKARVKFYCKVPAGAASADFAEVFEWLTLGGRITALKNDKALIQRLFDLVHGVDSRSTAGDDDNPTTRAAADLNRYIHRTELAKTGAAQPQVAPCSVYFSLAGNSAPEPTAKLILGAKYSSRTDLEIAQGVERFLLEQGWPCSFGSYVELVRGCFPGVPLDSREDKLHTFICLSRKGSGSDEWTLQTYYNPLYHHYPRE